MRVLEQEGITEDLSQIILVDKTPSMGACYLYLRGENKRYYHETNCRLFDTNQQAEEYLQKVIGWLDEVFVKPVEPKRGDRVEVWNDSVCFAKLIFLAKIEGSKYPYICVDHHDEGNFLNGLSFDCTVWKHMKPLTKSGYNPDTKIYEGELS